MGSKINKNKQKPSVSMWFLFSASMIVIMFFLWYFLIYVSGNEDLLIQKSFRVLNQVGENFKGRENSYRKLSQSTDMKNKLSSGDWSGYWKNFDQAKSSMKKYYSNLEIDKDTLNQDYFYFSNNHKFISDSLSTLEGKKVIYFNINKTSFFEPLERKDVFEELIIIKENSQVNSKSVIYNHEFVYSSFIGGIDVKNLDSLIISSEGFSAGIVKDIKLSGVEYILFMTKIQLLNNESYYIGGIINKDNYVSQTRSINAYIALLLIIFFFIFLFSIPLIKLRLISENQQLKTSDLASAFVSVILGVFFTLLVILSLFSNYQREKNVNISLENLSESIRHNLIEEIKQIDSTLTLFHEITNKLSIDTPENDKKYFYKLTLGLNNQYRQKSDTLPMYNFLSSRYYKKDKKLQEDKSYDGSKFLLPDLPYKYFKVIFDLDSTGQQIAQASSRMKPLTWDNYSFRRYFRESGEWDLDSLQIMMDFIVSNTSGEKLGVVSKKYEEFVYVITSRLYSVINTVLPLGYGFCVIDNNGNVKFHSNSERMLQENFIRETENSKDLKQAIYGNLSTHFSADYVGKDHLCYIQPIKSLPLYLVTFYDQSFSRSINLKITSLTFIFTFLVLVMVFLIVIGSRIVAKKKSELNRNLDIFIWLKPNKLKIDKSRNIYITNIIAIILMIIAYVISTPTTTILLIFLIIINQFVTTYCYMNFVTWDHFRKNFITGLLFPTTIIIYLFIYFAFKTLAPVSILHLFIYIFFSIAANIVVIKFGNKIHSRIKDKFHFYLYFYSWLVLIVMAPVFIFFITFFHHESKSEVAHNLYTYAKKETTRNYNIDKFYDENVQKIFKVFKNDLKEKGVYYLDGISKSKYSEFQSVKVDSVEETLGNILFYLKPDMDTQSSERKSLINKLSGFAVSSNLYPDSVFVEYPAEQIHPSNRDAANVYYYKGKIDTFGFGKIQRWIYFIFVILFLGYICFRILKFVLEKVLGSSIGLFLVRKTFHNVIKEHIDLKNNLMIQFSSTCEKHDYDNKKNEEKYFSKVSHTTINFNQIEQDYPNFYEESTGRILIRNFYIDFKQPELECERLSIINRIAEEGQVQLTIVLNHSYERIIDENIQLIEEEKDEERLKQLHNLLKDLESINNKFIHLFPPVTENEFEADDESAIGRKSSLDQLKEIVKQELIVSDYLMKKYEHSIASYANVLVNAEVKNPHEKIILKIQQYAIGYYNSIWEACSIREKILLYDISDEMLLNDKNKKVIKILLYKGLLKYNGYIDIMNKSFRNFIVTKFESEYEEEYKQKFESTGKWANYRAPFLLIGLALAFFIALQENILTNLTSILPAIIAALGLITKVSGIFSKSSSTGSTGSQNK